MTVLKATKINILKAAQTVKQGGIVAYPTETVYGLGCDPLNSEAVKRVLEIKGNRTKPFPVLAATLTDVDKIAFMSASGKKLASKFWPGPLTMVFQKKSALSDVVTLGLGSVGLRIPNNNVALSLIQLSGGLLIGSSANLSGENPPKSIQDMSEQLIAKVDMVLDGGVALEGTPSTVVDLTLGKPKILRAGPISLKQIFVTLALSDQ
ncbi:MAG: threonylcarbamoyl-AMP synthase [Candidatus Bathyarchaeota archaeon]|nr:L-threonylcarbamoyladenylate synthase [Candidatus Bathyarchaeum tardum]WGM90318.1 MAG: L-threonylcarbamoyladenylate synthase [Candidatus Bathyarchaeum tardum]WNZ29601.1 MAG: threonylcarbamoyl-AMP synthase [Candidatus Bathyarchaeota archaeon]